MQDEGLLIIDVNTMTHAVKLVYEPDAPFDVDEIKAYVDDMTSNRANEILIFEGRKLMSYLHRKDGVWTDIANRIQNGV